MKHASGNSALTRIQSLLDENSFVQIGTDISARSTDFHLYKEDTPSDGVLTGYGLINEKLIYIYSQNASVLGGSIGEMHSRKITHLYDMALNMGAPIIGILDCSGLRLQESVDALNGLGSIYQKQAQASGIIPQISLIMGNCGGGTSLIPALSDFTFLEKTNGCLFLHSPDAIMANRKECCDTASAEWKSKYTQNIDVCGTADEIYTAVRKLIDILPANNRFSIMPDTCTDDLNRSCEGFEQTIFDSAAALSMIADNNEFFETKKETAKDMITGFIRLNGITIGCIANQTSLETDQKNDAPVLTAEGAKKAASFITFCDAFHIPVLTLSNVSGFERSMSSEINAASACASLTAAYASATVPKVTVITGQAMGSAGVIMGGKPLGIDLVYTFEHAMIGSLDGTHAAKILYEEEPADIIRQKAADYDAQYNRAASAASRGYVDAMIRPSDIRKYLISAFDMLASKQDSVKYKKHLSI